MAGREVAGLLVKGRAHARGVCIAALHCLHRTDVANEDMQQCVAQHCQIADLAQPCSLNLCALLLWAQSKGALS